MSDRGPPDPAAPDDLPDLSDEELDRLSAIGPEDIERAQQAWREDAPRPFRDLLDAGEEEPE